MATKAGPGRSESPTRPGPGSASAGAVRSSRPEVVSARFTVTEFATPAVRDALVLGKRSPIGCIALRKALGLLQTSPFAHIEFEDDVISDIIARESIVRIIGRDRLIALTREHVKPLMTDQDILHMDIEARLHLEVEA